MTTHPMVFTLCLVAVVAAPEGARAQSSGEEQRAEQDDEADQPLPISSARRGVRIAAHVVGGVGVATLAASIGVFVHASRLDDDWAAEDQFLRDDASSASPTLTDEERESRFLANEELNQDLQTLSAVVWALAASVWTLMTAAIVLYVVGYHRPRGPWQAFSPWLTVTPM